MLLGGGEGTEQEAVKMFISRQAAELNKLRQDCARLVNELGEKNSKLQQEELQKKNAEQAVAQLKVTLLFSALLSCTWGFIWAKSWAGQDGRSVRIASAHSLATHLCPFSLDTQISICG